MLDLSVEPLEENVKISKDYFKRLNDLNIWLEVEIWITGWEEEWADTTSDTKKMYTSSEELAYTYRQHSWTLQKEIRVIWGMEQFTIQRAS